jgi:PAS domain S-box-containing protein
MSNDYIIEREDFEGIMNLVESLGVFKWEFKEDILLWNDKMYDIFERDISCPINDAKKFMKYVDKEDTERLNIFVKNMLSREDGVKSDSQKSIVYKVFINGQPKYIKSIFYVKDGFAIGLNEDVTELCNLKREFLNEENMLDVYFKNNPNGMMLFNGDYKILSVNDELCNFLNIDKGTLEESYFLDIFNVKNEKFACLMEDLRDGKIDYFSVCNQYQNSNLSKWFEVMIVASRNHNAEVKHYMAQFQDVTNKKQKNAVLKEKIKDFRTHISQTKSLN